MGGDPKACFRITQGPGRGAALVRSPGSLRHRETWSYASTKRGRSRAWLPLRSFLSGDSSRADEDELEVERRDFTGGFTHGGNESEEALGGASVVERGPGLLEPRKRSDDGRGAVDSDARFGVGGVGDGGTAGILGRSVRCFRDGAQVIDVSLALEQGELFSGFGAAGEPVLEEGTDGDAEERQDRSPAHHAQPVLRLNSWTMGARNSTMRSC